MSNENLSEDILGGILEKVRQIESTSSFVSRDLNEIQKNLEEEFKHWRYDLGSPMKQLANSLNSTSIQNSKKIIESNQSILRQQSNEFERLGYKIDELKKEVQRPKKLIPILLTAILIVLLIK